MWVPLHAHVRAVRACARARVQSVEMSAIGKDLVIFLAASVFVTPLSQLLNITPVLGFLVVGAAIGPCASVWETLADVASPSSANSYKLLQTSCDHSKSP